MKCGIIIKLLLLTVLVQVASAKAEDGKSFYLKEEEQAWKSQVGKEITEENLIESLKLSPEDQKKKLLATIEKKTNEYEHGLLSKEEFYNYIQSMPVPTIERSAALSIIIGNKYQSQEIDQVILEIYAQNMDDPTTRLQCIEVMLNNNPKNGLVMLRAYITDKERITLSFRLLGASLMIKHGEPVSQDMIKEGLLSPEKNTRAMAERIQKELTTLDKKKPLVPVKTIAPPKSIE